MNGWGGTNVLGHGCPSVSVQGRLERFVEPYSFRSYWYDFILYNFLKMLAFFLSHPVIQ